MSGMLQMPLREFRKQAETDQLKNRLEQAYIERFPDDILNDSERSSWRKSLCALARFLEYIDAPLECDILIEYLMPIGNRRADCILVGEDKSSPHIIIIELKQWSADRVDYDEIYGSGWLRVNDGRKGYLSEHPCQQIREYHRLLSGALDFGEETPRISTMVFLHNYIEATSNDILRDESYKEFLSDTLLVTRHNGHKQAKELLSTLLAPSISIVNHLQNPVLRYSDSFITSFRNGLQASRLFKASSEQEKAFKGMLGHINQATGKPTCVIVEGIVGTGKTVLAMKLVDFLMQQKKNPAYFVRSKAIGNCVDHLGFCKIAIGRTSHAVVDEAHRLLPGSLSGYFKNKELVVFFIDDNQWLLPHETCRVETLENEAKRHGLQLVHLSLTEQLRCQGASAYMTWVDDILFKHKAPRLEPSEQFTVTVVDDPTEMESDLRKYAEKERVTTRIVAGFCWDWATRNTPSGGSDITIGSWSARWNSFGKYREWNEASGFYDEVGAIYTVQGFEYGYVGVLLGPDLKLHDGRLVVSTDECVDPGLKKHIKGQNNDASSAYMVDQAIRNIYYILMTRAKYGVYLYAFDPEVQRWLKSLI
ncbi:MULTISPECIES: DNA/RNA helicase domain-containing protein [Cobetia]|uniref:DNA/RNA helicase domain-containing protein n=1 Tax=Cobetia TaxID=204286 RepID=UPI000986F418|nr:MULTISPECIES: DNA/RNA helicase domain-containing protein [Cobetia]POR07188.1 hypothetical protein BOH68_06210 [Cobetia sp. MM1IDA2H-1]